MKNKRFTPYIRLATGKEKSSSLRDSIRLAFYQGMKKPFYVMVQRGFPQSVMAVGPSKRDVMQSILVVGLGVMSFKQWATKIRKRASR